MHSPLTAASNCLVHHLSTHLFVRVGEHLIILQLPCIDARLTSPAQFVFALH